MDAEKTFQFILNTQAKHETTIQIILETQAKHEATIQTILEAQARHEQRFTTLVDVCMSLAHHGEETDRRIRELSEETNRRFQEVSQRFQDTDYKLNALIDTVDKLIKRNGSR